MSLYLALPWQARSVDTGPQSSLRHPNPMKGGSYQHHQLLNVFRRTTGQILAQLCPNVLDRIEFRRAGRKVVNMEPRVLRQERLHLLTLMNRRVIPDQNDWTAHMPQQMSQEVNDLLTRQVAAIRLGAQFDLAAARRDKQRADRIDARMVLKTRPNPRRLTTGCPSALERADQRLPIFINKYKGCAQVTPLFLSSAKGIASNARSPGRPAETRRVAASDNSSPGGVTHAKRHWGDTARQTTSKSPARSAPTSSSLPHSLGHRRPSAGSVPDVSTVEPTSDWAVQEARCSVFAVGCSGATLVASGEHCGCWPRRPGLLRLGFCLAVIRRGLVSGVRLTVDRFHLVSCAT